MAAAWQRCSGGGEYRCAAVSYKYRHRTYVRRGRVGGGVYPSVSRQAEDGAHKRHSGRDSLSMLVAAFSALIVWRAPGVACCLAALSVCSRLPSSISTARAVLCVQRHAQRRNVLHKARRLAALRHDVQRGAGAAQHRSRLSFYLCVPLGRDRRGRGHQSWLYSRCRHGAVVYADDGAHHKVMPR